MNNKTQQYYDKFLGKLINNAADEIDKNKTPSTVWVKTEWESDDGNETFPQRVAIEEDGDEIFHFDGRCNKWECQEGFDKDGKSIMPFLVPTWHDDDRMAFWECPTCHCSYGPVQ